MGGLGLDKIGIRLGSYRPGSGSSLLTGLVSYWKLDETSGTRADSFGTNNLTDNNTVASITGKISNGATFVAANSEALTVADVDNSLDGGNRDFTYSMWVKTITTTAQFILDKANTGDHALDISSAGFPRFSMHSFLFSATSISAVNNGNWHQLIFWYDFTASRLNLVIDNGTIVQSAVATGMLTGPEPLMLGCVGPGTGTQFFDGSLDEVGRWNRLLSAGERTQLWNGGVGLAYPFA